jgi:hypothetical protein
MYLQTSQKLSHHYYGDIVRVLFLVAALIMVIGLPAVKEYVNVPVAFSVMAIVILGMAAGFTNPVQLWDAGMNAGIAAIGLLVFETAAVASYTPGTGPSSFFITNMVLGFLFLLAVYFSVKTLRGLWLENHL